MGELNIAPLSSWGLGTKRPIIVSGPCSAESEEQVMETAERLADKGIDVLRAGIWKPRTRPGSFEGLGKIALKPMAQKRQKKSLKRLKKAQKGSKRALKRL